MGTSDEPWRDDPGRFAEQLVRSSSYCSMVHVATQLTAAVQPALGELGLNPLTYNLLGLVFAEPGLTPAELARRSGATPQHLTGVLDALEHKGWISREGVRGRGRRTRLAVTAPGVQALVDGWPLVHAVGKERLTDTQHRQLQALLDLYREPRPDDADAVVLVDEEGRDAGVADRRRVHGTATPRHRAFSTYLADAKGRVLVTRRALTKTAWPGVWTNAACGHVRPGETAVQAALRRVPEELGPVPRGLRVVLPDFAYRAVDASGIVENELCPVLVGRISTRLTPDPDEVAEHAWVDWTDLRRTAATMPHLLSPWSVLQIEQMGDDPWQ